MTKSLIPLYVHTFFGGFMPIYAVFTLLIIDGGMTAWQVSVLLASWSMAGFILEVPSGALADWTSRKWTLAFGQALNAVAFFLMVAVPSFHGFLVGFVLWGASAAMKSGTYEAYVYDELASLGKEGDYVTVNGRLSATRASASMLAALSAAPLSHWGYPAVAWASVVACVISMAVAMLMPEAPRVKKVGRNSYANILLDGFRITTRHAKMLITTFGLAVITVYISMTGDYGQVLARLSGLPDYGIGLFMAASYGIMALASTFAARASTRLGSGFGWLLPAAAAAFTCAAAISTVLSLILVFVWVFLLKTAWHLHDNEMQRQSSSEIRATVASVVGLGATAFQIAMTLAVGAVAGAWSYSASIIAFGTCAFVIGSLILTVRLRIRP